MKRDLTARIFGAANSAGGNRQRHGWDARTPRRDALAKNAGDALDTALDVASQAVIDGKHTEPQTAAELHQRWTWVAALQRQAEIHAQLAHHERD